MSSGLSEPGVVRDDDRAVAHRLQRDLDRWRRPREPCDGLRLEAVGAEREADGEAPLVVGDDPDDLAAVLGPDDDRRTGDRSVAARRPGVPAATAQIGPATTVPAIPGGGSPWPAGPRSIAPEHALTAAIARPAIQAAADLRAPRTDADPHRPRSAIARPRCAAAAIAGGSRQYAFAKMSASCGPSVRIIRVPAGMFGHIVCRVGDDPSPFIPQ